MQLAPDGKIYSCTPTGTDVLHVIHDPDAPGLDCQFEQHGIQLFNYNAFSMPNFPNYRLGPLDGSPCDTLGLDNHPEAWYRYAQDTLNPLAVAFTDLSYYEPNTWQWDFGDGSAASAERHPVHTYSQPGVYEVCLSAGNANSTDTHCKTLYIGVSAEQNPVMQQQVAVGPNPFGDRLYITLDIPLPGAEMRLYDLAGRLMLRGKLVTGINTLDTAALPTGLYFYELTRKGEQIKCGKVVKTRG